MLESIPECIYADCKIGSFYENEFVVSLDCIYGDSDVDHNPGLEFGMQGQSTLHLECLETIFSSQSKDARNYHELDFAPLARIAPFISVEVHSPYSRHNSIGTTLPRLVTFWQAACMYAAYQQIPNGIYGPRHMLTDKLYMGRQTLYLSPASRDQSDSFDFPASEAARMSLSQFLLDRRVRHVVEASLGDGRIRDPSAQSSAILLPLGSQARHALPTLCDQASFDQAERSVDSPAITSPQTSIPPRRPVNKVPYRKISGNQSSCTLGGVSNTTPASALPDNQQSSHAPDSDLNHTQLPHSTLDTPLTQRPPTLRHTERSLDPPPAPTPSNTTKRPMADPTLNDEDAVMGGSDEAMDPEPGLRILELEEQNIDAELDMTIDRLTVLQARRRDVKARKREVLRRMGRR